MTRFVAAASPLRRHSNTSQYAALYRAAAAVHGPDARPQLDVEAPVNLPVVAAEVTRWTRSIRSPFRLLTSAATVHGFKTRDLFLEKSHPDPLPLGVAMDFRPPGSMEKQRSPLTPSLSPSVGERVSAGRVRGIPGEEGVSTSVQHRWPSFVVATPATPGASVCIRD
jgi:hypothetical protein